MCILLLKDSNDCRFVDIMMWNFSYKFNEFFIVLFYFLCKMTSVGSVGQNLKDKVQILDEEVHEQQYRETNRLLSIRNYALEDFFWTGSGDGPPPPEPASSWTTSSIATTTLLATIFIESPPGNDKPPSSSEEDCVSECPISPYDGTNGDIKPSRPGSGKPSKPPPDQRYWLLTVLQAPVVPLPQNLDVRLAKLYRTAFLRQQEEHLGIIATETLRPKTMNSVKSFTSNPRTSNTDNEFTRKTTSVGFASEEVDDLKYVDTNSSSNISFFDTEAPFEFITNYFDITTPSTQRILIKRDVVNDPSFNITGIVKTSSANSTVDVVKRQISENDQPSVEVFLYNVTREGESKEELKVIYWVSVGGHPVPALTAARDMRLLADSEVVAELGFPITTKAEPYLKFPEPLNGVTRATNAQDTWLIVGAAIMAILILVIMVAFLICRLAYKRKSSATSTALKARPSIDSKGVQYPSEGKDNMAYMQEDGKLISVVSPRKQVIKVPGGEQQGSPTRRYVRGPQYKINRVGSADSSSSASSSSDLSQMNATLRQRQKLFEQQLHSEYASINKKNKSKHRKIRSKKVGVVYTPRAGSPVEIKGDGTLQRFLVSDPPSPAETSSDISTFGEDVTIRRPSGPVSPTSYLSMPSVKSFPRSNAVEPLSKVLEPLSVRHLDMDSPVHQYGTIKRHHFKTLDDPDKLEHVNGYSKNLNTSNVPKIETPKSSSHLIRLGSLDKDPGVIGPIVWDLHSQRMKDSKAIVDAGNGANISRMRQRFTELVDDAFSLFGNDKTLSSDAQRESGQFKNVSGIDKTKQTLPVMSSFTREPVGTHGATIDRPLTALPPRPPLPKQSSAWGSTSTTSMSRSTSAGGMQRRPVVDTVRVKSEGVLLSTDPALPLLQAIRSELNKLPGSSDA